MKRVTYVGTAVLVDDDFGSTLLEYAAALARSDTSETLQFRGVNEGDLRLEEVAVILGPASEIVIELLPDDTPAVPPDNTAVIADMRRRIQELRDGNGPVGRFITPEPADGLGNLVDGLDI